MRTMHCCLSIVVRYMGPLASAPPICQQREPVAQLRLSETTWLRPKAAHGPFDTGENSALRNAITLRCTNRPDLS